MRSRNATRWGSCAGGLSIVNKMDLAVALWMVDGIQLDPEVRFSVPSLEFSRMRNA